MLKRSGHNLLAMLIALALGVLSGCSSQQAAPAAGTPAAGPAKVEQKAPEQPKAAQPSAPAPKKSLGKVKVAINAANSVYGPLFVAEKNGFFRDEGLDIEWIVVRGGGTTTYAALMGGDVEFAIGGTDAGVAAAAGNASILLVSEFSDRYPYSLWTVPGISSVKELKGKKVGINRLGSISHTALRFMLSHNQMDPERDAQYLQIGTSPDRIAAIQQKQIDAAMFTPDDVEELRKGGLKMLASTYDSMPPTSFVSVWTRSELIEKKPEVVAAGIKALRRGIEFTANKANKDAVVKITAEALKATEKASMFALAYDDYLPAWTWKINRDGNIDNVIKMLTQLGTLKQPVSASQVINGKFVQD